MRSRKRIDNRRNDKTIGDAVPGIMITPRVCSRDWMKITIHARSPQEALTGLHVVRLDAEQENIHIVWQRATLTSPGCRRGWSLLNARGVDGRHRRYWLLISGVECGTSERGTVATAMTLEAMGFGSTADIFERIRSLKALRTTLLKQ
jgi:hypothetical protein